MDFILHATVCKHIHLVQILYSKSLSFNKDHTSGNDSTFASSKVQVEENTSISTHVQSTSISEESASVSHDQSGTHEVGTVVGNEEPDISSLQYLSKCLHTSQKSTEHTCMSAKDRAVSVCKKIEVALLECVNTEAVLAGTKHLNAALTIIKAMESINRQNE